MHLEPQLPNVLIGGPEGHVPGSVRYPCEICGGAAWVSPSAFDLVKAKVPIFCLPCGMRVIMVDALLTSNDTREN